MSFTWNSSKQSSAASAAIAIGERRDRIVDVRIGAPEGMEACVDVLHEAMEVDALLAAHIGGGEEQVHQHGLAAPDLAHDVEAVRPVRRRFAAEQAGEQAAAVGRPRRRIVAAQPRPQRLEPFGDEFLGGVGCQFAGRHHRPEGWQRPTLRRDVGARAVHVRAADSASAAGVQRGGFRGKQPSHDANSIMPRSRATPVATDPFPHVVVADFVPPDACARWWPTCRRWAGGVRFRWMR